MRTALLTCLVILSGCAAPLPPPAFQPAPPTPLSDLRSVDWPGPKPTLEDLETYVENFRKLAFSTEWNGRHPYIKKWTGTGVCAPEKYRVPIENTLRKLRVATGLNLRLSDLCDIRVEDYPSIHGCRFKPTGLVGVGYGVEIGECLEEELSQLMGLYNDIPYRWTSWNDDLMGTVNRLTWHDAVMIRVLYQQELHQGMSEAAAMKIVPRLMRKVIGEVQ
ncbi:MAG: DUF2927 domain-containing protein [Rhodospirillales bacterium]